MQITLQSDLVSQLQARVDESKEFSTVEEYVNYVLTEVIKQTGADSQGDNYTKSEEDAVKDRLESLGYLD